MCPQEQNATRQELGEGRLITAGEELDLRTWLEVEWFYPESFRPVSVLETSRSFLAFGEREVLKFTKGPAAGSSARSFTGSIGAGSYSASEQLASNHQYSAGGERRWAEMADEIGDNLPFAPTVYRGIRALRWVDGEAQWIGERTAADLKTGRPTFAADEFAIAMRRLPENRRLDRLLAGGGADPEKPLIALAAALVRQQRRGVHWGKRLFESDTDTVLELFYEKYVAEPRSFVLLNGPYLDSFSRSIFQEIISAIELAFAQLEDTFIERGARGLITDGHGDLQLDRMWYEVRGRGVPELSILGRQVVRARSFGSEHGVDRTLYRYSDALDDIAAVAAELRGQGFSKAAEQFEAMVFQLHPQIRNPELYRFFLMVNTVRQAKRSLDTSSPDDKILNSDLLLKSRAVGIRAALGLNSSFVLAFPAVSNDDHGTEARERRRDLMRSMSELIDAPMVTLDQALIKQQQKARGLGPFHRLAEEEAALFDSVIETIRAEAENGLPVVTEWPSANRGAEERLATEMQSLGLPLLVVHCGLGRTEIVNRGTRQSDFGPSSLEGAGRPTTTAAIPVTAAASVDKPGDLSFSSGGDLSSAPSASNAGYLLGAVGRLQQLSSTVVEPTVAAPDLSLGILRDFASRLGRGGETGN